MSDGEQTGDKMQLSQVLPVIGGLKVPVYGVSFETGSVLSDMKTMAGLGESGAYVITADGQDSAVQLRAMVRAAL